jgi:hypothetical protein
LGRISGYLLDKCGAVPDNSIIPKIPGNGMKVKILKGRDSGQ